MNRQDIVRVAGFICTSVILTAALGGCAAPLILGVPAVVFTEVLPRAVNGKGLAEDGVDMATGKDCRLVEGAVRKDRKFCETRDSPQTKKDFKGFSDLKAEPSKRLHLNY
jgi:hypothetical protein